MPRQVSSLGRKPRPTTAEGALYGLAGELDLVILLQSVGDVGASALNIFLLVVAKDEPLYPLSGPMAISPWPIEEDEEAPGLLELLIAAQASP